MLRRWRKRKDRKAGETGGNGEDDDFGVVRARIRRDRPPPGELAVWRDDVRGSTWTPPGTSLEIVEATFVDVRIPRVHFEELLVDGATFDRVTFDGVEVDRGDLGVADGTTYRDCLFERCFLAEVDPGLARFDTCRFIHCTLDGWFANGAEFVGCTFDGSSIRDATFFGRPFECGDATRRKVNEFRDNDFSRADLTGTRFDGVDLLRQRLPSGKEVLDDAAARLEAASKAIRTWPEDRQRAAAAVLAMLVRPDETPKQLVLDPSRFTDPAVSDVAADVFQLLRRRGRP
jgi:uncharacterized protein YjbI with pentapeptide repeats